jgi:hypothetical protein
MPDVPAAILHRSQERPDAKVLLCLQRCAQEARKSEAENQTGRRDEMTMTEQDHPAIIAFNAEINGRQAETRLATRTADPIALANVTVQAVDQIGDAAAKEIIATAEALQDGASKIALKLRDLAEAMRAHTRLASDHVAEFCNKATAAVEMVRELEQRLDGKS